jgi:hypothetical protein
MDPADIFRCLIDNSRINDSSFKIYKNYSSPDLLNFSLKIPLSSLHKNVSIEVSEFFDLREKKAIWNQEKMKSLKEYEDFRVPAILISDIQYQSIKIEMDEIRKEINKMVEERDEIYKIIQEKYNELSKLDAALNIRKHDVVSFDKKENLKVKTNLSFSNKKFKVLSKLLSLKVVNL